MKETRLKRTCYTTALLCMLGVSVLHAQGTTPALELEEYRIVGRDTRVFTIEGERMSTVYYTPMDIRLPAEERSIKESEGLIGDDEREHRTPRFVMTTGPTAELDYTFGAYKTNDLYGRIGYAGRTRGASLTLTHWSADAHTPANLAPTAQDIAGMGYLRTVFGTVRGEVGFTRHDDDAVSETLRPGSRTLSRFRMGGAIDRSLWGLDLSGAARLESGTYSDLLTPGDMGEMLITGDAEATGRLLGTDVILNAATNFYELEDDNGSSLSAGITAAWLFADRLSVSAGVAAATAAMPGDDTEFHLYPQAAMDIALPAGLYARAAYQPRLVPRTFSDLFAMNGLVITTPDADSAAATVLLYEHRSADLDGELGYRHSGGLSLAVGVSYVKSEDAPVFSRYVTPGGDEFYQVVRNAELTRQTIRLTGAFDPDGAWNIEGRLAVSDASWNFSGDVPYIPDMEGHIAASYLLMDIWTIRTVARYYGTHYLEIQSTDTEDSFLMIDIGMERPVYRDLVAAALELRNITDVDGSWWSGAYRTPGIGLYLGVRAHY